MVSHGNKGRSRRSIPSPSTVAHQTIDYKLSNSFYFRVGGKSAKAEADGGVGLVGGEAEGAKDVGGFGDAGGAGGAGGGGEVGLEGGEEVVRDKAFKLQVGVTGVAAVTGRPVEGYWIGTDL